MAHKRSIRLLCMMSFPTVSLLLFQPSFLFQPICSDSIRAPWHFVDARAYAITAVSARDVAIETPMSSKQSREQVSKRLDPDVLEVVQHGQEQPQKTPPRNWVDRSERRNNWDRRTAPGNGTASSAVAPSQRPVCDAHQSKIFGSGIPIMSPRARILGRLTSSRLISSTAGDPHCPTLRPACYIPPGKLSVRFNDL